jgi:hypothetical protein
MSDAQKRLEEAVAMHRIRLRVLEWVGHHAAPPPPTLRAHLMGSTSIVLPVHMAGLRARLQARGLVSC